MWVAYRAVEVADDKVGLKLKVEGLRFLNNPWVGCKVS